MANDKNEEQVSRVFLHLSGAGALLVFVSQMVTAAIIDSALVRGVVVGVAIYIGLVAGRTLVSLALSAGLRDEGPAPLPTPEEVRRAVADADRKPREASKDDSQAKAA